MSVFFIAILLYLLYRFIAGFVIPVVRTTRNVRQQFQNMNGHANDATENRSGTHAEEPPQAKSSSKLGEYIDFEEIK